MAVSNNKHFLEITVETERVPHNGRYYYDEEELDDGDAAVVRIGDLAVVEATAARRDETAKWWLRSILSEQRHRRGPLVAGLVVLSGSFPNKYYDDHRKRRAHRSDPNPIGAIALCLGGSHVLLYAHETYSGEPPKVPFLADFLGNRRVAVVGVGIKEAAKRLGEDWGVHVARPVELKELVVKAYGKKAEVETRKGKKVVVDVAGSGLERLARVALGGIRLRKWPRNLVEHHQQKWGYFWGTQEQYVYIPRDAYLFFEIGLKCFKKLGLPTD